MIKFHTWLENNKTNVMYHVTQADRIASIAQKGLVVSEKPHWGGDLGEFSMGKIFLSPTVEHALYYGLTLFKEHLENNGMAYMPVLLRTQVLNTEIDPQDKLSHYTQTTITPQQIEAWWHTWQPLRTASNYIGIDQYYRWNGRYYEDWEGDKVSKTIPGVMRDVKKFFAGT